MTIRDRDEIIELSSTLVRLDKLFDKGIGAQGEFVSDATVSATIFDEAGASPLTYNDDMSVPWPITLTFVAGTRGRYQFTLLKELKVTRGLNYKVIIIALRPSGVKRTFEKIVPASGT